MISIINYGMGNLRSVQKALEYVGYAARITDDEQTVKKSSAIILPGVGAFKDAMSRLKTSGLNHAIKEAVMSGVPFLGICLGMQLIFDKSYEGGLTYGLGLIKGDIVEIPHDLKVPHIGWNKLKFMDKCTLINSFDASRDIYTYFVHSYYLTKTDKNIIKAVTLYGVEIPALIEYKNIFACQFHPEKSGRDGLNILKKFGEMAR